MNKPSPLICVPITETAAQAFLAALHEAEQIADAIELRLDFLAVDALPQVLEALRERAAQITKPLIFTFRPREQGGGRDVSLSERQAFWRSLPPELIDALAYADFELDLVESFVAAPPPLPWAKIICSQHDFTATPTDLLSRYDRMARTPAAVVKLAAQANRIDDCLRIFELIAHAQSSKPVIALAMGAAGVTTRVLALSRGALLTFGALRRGAESASGQPTVRELRELYRVHQLSPAGTILGVVGHPVGHSRSPLLHNTALAQLGLDAVYLPFEVEDAGSFVRDFVRPATRRLDWRMRGLSVTIPHKVSIMPHLDFIDATARNVGAVNTVVVEGDELRGYNTDVDGAMKPLAELIELRGANVAVLGAGGAARAVCYGLKNRGAQVTVYARAAGKAQPLADEFGGQCAALDDFSGAADIVINCTPLGMRGHSEGASPIAAEALRDVKLVYDLVYNPRETQLLSDARWLGCRTLDGLAMLAAQAAEQFRWWMGKEAPVELMRQTLTESLPS